MRKLSAYTLVLSLCSSAAFALDAPSNVSAELDPTDGIVELNWTAVADASGYNVYRDDSYIDTILAPASSYSDSAAGSSYYITAFDDSVMPTDFSPRSNTAVVSAINGACSILPSHAAITSALRASVAPSGGPTNGGFDLNMWAAVVNRDGVVCAITHTGNNRGDQWPGSRVIAAQKANTANAFSLPGLSLATANLWAATQPGGSLFGLQFSNPVDPTVAYGTANNEPGDANGYGTPEDPMVGNFVGGINVFGGGLALYNSGGTLIGAIGVSGDTSCADHNIAWRTRSELELDYVPGGISSPERPDNINYVGDAGNTALEDDFSHPLCTIAGADAVSAISASLPAVRP
ncbi:MAG: heme-binding protein [Granulosicoccus sp.]